MKIKYIYICINNDNNNCYNHNIIIIIIIIIIINTLYSILINDNSWFGKMAALVTSK